jgi:hypothetical protein
MELTSLNHSLEYKQIGRREHIGGSLGVLDIRVHAACKKVYTPNEDIQALTSKFMQDLAFEIEKSVMLSDPTFISRKEMNLKALLGCFESPIFWEEIPNQYTSQPHGIVDPWLVVTTHIGRITIGQHKHVLSIEWGDTRGTLSADELFKDEDTTKFDKCIHAWTIEHAKVYIQKIINSAK